MIDWTPSAVAIQLGPLPLYWYGIAYAVGLAGAYAVMVRQARRLGENAAIIGNGLIVIAIAALIGGRLYHVVDEWQLYAGDPIKIILPPYSGLGVFGGFVTGTLAFIWLTRQYRVSAWRWGDVVAPGLFVMQAVGRLGNFFNQELYGPPTTLPWGIAIDCAHRVIEYPCTAFPLGDTHFHPLFLYESLSAAVGLAVLLWLSRRPPTWLRIGDLMPITVIWIGAVRFLLEFLRIGNWRLGDIPTAQLFGAAFVAVGVALLWLRRRQGAPPFLAGVPEGDPEEELSEEELFWARRREEAGDDDEADDEADDTEADDEADEADDTEVDDEADEAADAGDAGDADRAADAGAVAADEPRAETSRDDDRPSR